MGLQHAAPRFPHWNYFLALEEDLERASRYVELVDANGPTYSLEFAHLLFAAAAEVEVVAISLCHLFDQKSTASAFADCIAPLRKTFPQMWQERVFVPRTGLVLQPLAEWERRKNNKPLWWQSYNHVKHARHSAFEQATMKHAANALVVLFLFALDLRRYARDGKDVRVLETRIVMSQMIAPRARLFEVLT